MCRYLKPWGWLKHWVETSAEFSETEAGIGKPSLLLSQSSWEDIASLLQTLFICGISTALLWWSHFLLHWFCCASCTCIVYLSNVCAWRIYNKHVDDILPHTYMYMYVQHSSCSTDMWGAHSGLSRNRKKFGKCCCLCIILRTCRRVLSILQRCQLLTMHVSEMQP